MGNSRGTGEKNRISAGDSSETFSEGNCQNEWERPPAQQHLCSGQEQGAHPEGPPYTSSRLSVACFAANLPQVTWQPSDLNSSSIESVRANSQGLSNVLPFVEIDAANPPTSLLQEGEKYELVLCVNMIHISPWTATLGLFSMAGKVLRLGGKLVTYGPYAQDGVLAPESNQQFDLNLRSRDPSWGIRDITELKEVGAAQGLNLDQIIEMPANNKTLVFVKKAPGRL